MKAQLREAPHGILAGVRVFEIWYNGMLIGQVVGADKQGVRIISKLPMTTMYTPGEVNVMEVQIGRGTDTSTPPASRS
jgi:hypothetical protein